MTYQQPTQAVIQEFGLERYIADGNVYWIIPGSAPETWSDVSGFAETLHFGIYHFLPESVFLSWATGDPLASFMIPVVALALLVGLTCMAGALCLKALAFLRGFSSKWHSLSTEPRSGATIRHDYTRSPMETIKHGSTLISTREAFDTRRKRPLMQGKHQNGSSVFETH